MCVLLDETQRPKIYMAFRLPIYPDDNKQAAWRMKRVTARRRIVDLARVQTGEIEVLKTELDRLRQRTFPSFAHAARSRLIHCPDERL